MSKNKSFFQRAIAWVNQNLLLSLSLFLVIFIPLWPKIPLFQPIPGYIVRVRLEDIFVALTAIVWLVQLVRKKISWKSPLNVFILVYLCVGLISLFSAFFVIKTIPLLLPHISKAFLHLFRYIEYFSIFFFVYAAIKKPQHLKFFIIAFCFTIVAASIYGFGQKYWEWSVYSTMSPEFSSGIPLELVSQQARVQSTFAGHYDFAIFMGLLLPLVLVLLYTKTNRNQRIVLGLVFATGVWSLIVSSLRSAFVSYVFSVAVVTILLGLRQKAWPQRITWTGIRLILVYFFTGVMFLFFGNNLAALLGQAINRTFSPNHANLSPNQSVIYQYEQPVPKDEIDQFVSTPVTNTQPTQSIQLSDCAKHLEISLCIRLDSLWPQAIKGFTREPLLGSGFSTLNKTSFYDLAQADGVDNNYLRILGETGILGFIAFFAIIGKSLSIAWTKFSVKNVTSANLSIAYIGIVIGFLCNATLIDVFAASKIAFTFWGLTGIVLGYWKLRTDKN